jgi:hypothetical protein
MAVMLLRSRNSHSRCNHIDDSQGPIFAEIGYCRKKRRSYCRFLAWQEPPGLDMSGGRGSLSLRVLRAKAGDHDFLGGGVAPAARTTAQPVAPAARGQVGLVVQLHQMFCAQRRSAQGDASLAGVRTATLAKISARATGAAGKLLSRSVRVPHRRLEEARQVETRTHACAGENARGKQATNVSSDRALSEPAYRKTLLEIDSLCSRRIRSAGIALPNPKDRRFTR